MDRPLVAILAIGNELLRGDVENTNTRWLCQRLTERGAFVVHAAIVRDDPDHIARELAQALSYHPRLVVTTGGLGPTADDLTLAAIAAARGRPLALHPAALAMVEARYAELAGAGVVETGTLTASRQKMAMLPQGASPLSNRVGAAPAVVLELDGSTLVCLPGVPKELYDIFDSSLLPVLDRVLGSGVQYSIERFAVTTDESKLAGALAQVAAEHPDVYVKSHAAGFETDRRFRITLSTIAADPESAERAVTAAEQALARALRASGVPLSPEGSGGDTRASRSRG